MKIINKGKYLLAALSLSASFTATATATATASEFNYQPPSVTKIATDLQKVEGSHLERFKKAFEVQRLSENVYWVSISNYNVTVLVGDKSVLLIDAPYGAGQQLISAIKTITDKPLSAIAYSHAHADHVGDSSVIIKTLKNQDIAIYATKEVKDSLVSHKVTMPAPVTHIITDELKFEGHSFKVFNDFDGHTPDNTAFLIEDGKRSILHAIDLIHPDQLEFRSFSNVEDAIAYKNDIDRLMIMDWDVLVTGHSNLGYKKDVEFVQIYMKDIQDFIHQGFPKANFAKHLKNDSPFSWYAGYTDEIINFAHAQLSKKYREGREEEFDIVAKSHVEALFWAMFARAL